MSLRLFVAIDVEESIRSRLDQFVRSLQAHAPQARWVATANLHLTLKFIGNVPEAQLAAIARALAPPLNYPAITLRWHGWGFFPSESRPHVFWVGVEDRPERALARLAAGIEDRLSPLGIARETRPFLPHLTLARFRTPAQAQGLRRALQARPAEEFGSATVVCFHLYRSVLKPGGAEYTRLESFPFALEPR